ncbi:tetratricopeptide repeat protein [Candidatus Pseudothioglobus sp. Uisw_041]|uniref:tetratricopeptide repeat protein n=1 Tax=Candidatus Pseudothioglobus sp. Uisw_041 TaxID=3230996 RepID=UPI003A8B9029
MGNVGPSKKQIESVVSIISIGKFQQALEKTTILSQKYPDESLLFNLSGICYQGLRQLETAAEHYEKAVIIDPNYYKAHYNLGGVLQDLGKLNASVKSFERALSIMPDYAEAHNNVGNVFKELGQFDNAIMSFRKAIEINPDYFEAHYSLGKIFQDLDNIESAIISYEKVLIIKPDFAELHNNLGVIFQEINEIDSALKYFKNAIRIMPEFAEAYNNLGNVYKELNQPNKAINCYKNLVAINPNFADAHYKLGNILQDMGLLDEAIECYQKALLNKQDHAELYYNIGLIFMQLGDLDASIESFEKAIYIMPDFAQAHNSLGIGLNKVGQVDKALKSYMKALSINPDFAEVYFNLGNLMFDLNRLDQAVLNYEFSLNLKPGIDCNFGNLFHTRMQLCIWDNFSKDLEELIQKINHNEMVIDPFSLSSLTGDSQIQLKNSQTYSKNYIPTNNALSKINNYSNHTKIRIGYFSADFREHPVSDLSAELYELHDRSQFEIYAFSFGPNTLDEMNLRIKAGVDNFYDVQMMSDKDIVTLSRSLEIDIAIDLGGFSANNRARIFSMYLAPIQAGYLGYTYTMGSNFIDYLIADKIVIPKDQQINYSEKIAYLPNCYMANDTKIGVSKNKLTKKDVGLPSESFVFCCFNNYYKINPIVFKSWMAILSKVNSSILWLPDGNTIAMNNLKKEAKNYGINENRLFFAPRLTLKKDHLNRIQLADLFIDTFPFASHTSCSDALRVGLPVLTYIGDSFTARVSSSLLQSVGLPELITTTQDHYESLAIKLATDSEKLKDIKDKLKKNLLTSSLYNAQLFTKQLESVYLDIYDQSQQ